MRLAASILTYGVNRPEQLNTGPDNSWMVQEELSKSLPEVKELPVFAAVYNFLLNSIRSHFYLLRCQHQKLASQFTVNIF